MLSWLTDLFKPKEPHPMHKRAFILALPLLALAACSGNYPHTALPDFWSGTHLKAGQYVNQDCTVNGPMAYGLEATKRAGACTATAVREWFL